MPILKKKSNNSPLGPTDLFSNMKGGAAFRVIETYKSIRTSLMFTLSAGEDNSLLITSAEPNSGKSVTSANLSLSFAQTGLKILLVDCDMRNPSQQKIFTVENTIGLSNVLGGMVSFEEAVKRDTKENLDLLTAGQIPPNPSELLGSDNMKSLLAMAKKEYDFVILDCPPVELVSDTSSLLLSVPQTIVIARQNHAIYEEVIHTVESIKAVGGKILGAIITDVRESNKSYSYAAGAYSGYGRYGYGRYGRYGGYGRYGRYGGYGRSYYGRYGSYGHYGYGRYGYGYGRSHYGYGYGSAPKANTATENTDAAKTAETKTEEK